MTVGGLGIRTPHPIRLTERQTQPTIHLQPMFETPADLGVDLRKGLGGRETPEGDIGKITNPTPERIPAEEVPTGQQTGTINSRNLGLLTNTRDHGILNLGTKDRW